MTVWMGPGGGEGTSGLGERGGIRDAVRVKMTDGYDGQGYRTTEMGRETDWEDGVADCSGSGAGGEGGLPTAGAYGRGRRGLTYSRGLR